MNYVEIKRRANIWMEEKRASMFEVPAITKAEAEECQRMLQYAGFKPFIVTMGKEINVTLYLSDHK